MKDNSVLSGATLEVYPVTAESVSGDDMFLLEIRRSNHLLNAILFVIVLFWLEKKAANIVRRFMKGRDK